ncbi:MAG: flagellar biosynthesis anti-sigma factor FlgM [Armatimonadetes bacterium]|nr:flagellar biosynthesis anti-sigma factor FlgM [Armatimonadota bacterium]
MGSRIGATRRMELITAAANTRRDDKPLPDDGPSQDLSQPTPKPEEELARRLARQLRHQPPAVRGALVASLRERVSHGEYHADPRAIAARMVRLYREMGELGQEEGKAPRPAE